MSCFPNGKFMDHYDEDIIRKRALDRTPVAGLTSVLIIRGRK